MHTKCLGNRAFGVLCRMCRLRRTLVARDAELARLRQEVAVAADSVGRLNELESELDAKAAELERRTADLFHTKADLYAMRAPGSGTAESVGSLVKRLAEDTQLTSATANGSNMIVGGTTIVSLDDEAKLLAAALSEERALVRSKTAEIRNLHARLKALDAADALAVQTNAEAEAKMLGSLERLGTWERRGAEEMSRSVDALRDELLESRQRIAAADSGLQRADERRELEQAEISELQVLSADPHCLTGKWVTCAWTRDRGGRFGSVMRRRRFRGSKRYCNAATLRRSMQAASRSRF